MTESSRTGNGTPQQGGRRLAAIYVRVSSEHQGEKASPDSQEADCRQLAEDKGLPVVAVYRDTEKFRVRGKLVDPSGTRADRPGLQGLLRDAKAGQFSVIIAWREDRLYRGMRAMLAFLDVVQESKLDVLLARENFDVKMAPIKAWVAGMELEGMRERLTMGVKARLRAGKANTGQDRYGYRRVGEDIEIVPEEAEWVVKIYEWYVGKVPLMEIRQRLIEADAPQKGSTRPRTVKWHLASLQAILKAGKWYAKGVKVQTRAGEVFAIPCPPIISAELYQRYLDRREKNTKHPIHNARREYLASGLIYCSCNRKWGARTNSYTRRNRRGEKESRKTLYGAYYCQERHSERIKPDCPRTIGSKLADEIIWHKVLRVLDHPELLLAAAREKFEALRAEAVEKKKQAKQLEEQLAAIGLERQWVITQARKSKITESDMDTQLASLEMQEASLRREMSDAEAVLRMERLSGWEEGLEEWLEDVREGIKDVAADPQTEEDRRHQFEIKREIVQGLVEKVVIDQNRNLEVCCRLNFTERFVKSKQAGICIHTPASRARRLRGVCG